MADFRVQSGSSTISIGRNGSSANTTVNLPIAVDLTRAFVRLRNFQEAGSPSTPVTATENNNDFGVTAELIDTGSLRFTQYAGSGSYDVEWEVVEYIGAVSGANEFIVRHHGEMYDGTGYVTKSVAVSGIIDIDKCVPVMAGQRQWNGSLDLYVARATLEMYDSGGEQGVFWEKGGTAAGYVTVVSVVEFVGSNWSVQTLEHYWPDGGRSDTNWYGIPISDVGSWSNAFIVETFRSTTTSDNDDDWTRIYGPGTGSTQLAVRTAASAVGNSYSRFYIVSNPSMSVDYYNHTWLPSGDQGYCILDTDYTASNALDGTIPDMTQVSVFGRGQTGWTSATSPSQCINYYLTPTTYELYRGRSVGTYRGAFSVVTWPSGVTSGLVVTSSAAITIAETQNPNIILGSLSLQPDPAIMEVSSVMGSVVISGEATYGFITNITAISNIDRIIF